MSHKLNFLFLLALSAAPLHAQSVTPFGTGAAPAAAPAAPPAAAPTAATPVSPAAPPMAGDYSSGTAERSTDKIFDVNKDSVDIENGTMQWKNKTFSLGDSKLLRARLERYLASPTPSNDAVQHAKILAQIEELLSPGKITPKNRNANYQKAWDLLFKAGEFESDGQNCLTIASQVMKAYRDKQEARSLLFTQKQLEQTRKARTTDAISRAREMERKRDNAANRSVGGGGGGRPSGGGAGGKEGGGAPAMPAMPGGGGDGASEGTADLEERRSEISRMDAEIKTAGNARTALELASKLEFQTQIVTFLFQRRFQHASIATAFYRHTFNSSDQGLKVGDKEIKTMFPVSNYTPTLDTIDILSRTAQSDVTTAIKAVGQLYESGKRYKALERLQEAFFLGEYCPQIMFFDPAKKIALMDVWQNLQTLQKVGDERDLAAVEKILKKLAELAPDFPAAQVESRVKNAKSASNLNLFAAKQAAFAGNADKAAASLEKATKLWPQNPEIARFTAQVEGQADALSRLRPEFDSLLKEKKFREIFKRKEAFALALAQDTERLAKLKETLDATGRIEGMIIQARTLSGSGNAYLAWDVLEEAAKLDPNDTELSAIRLEMATVVGDYTRALAAAKREELAGKYGASLAWYIAAQDINRASDSVQKSIARVGALLLESQKK